MAIYLGAAVVLAPWILFLWISQPSHGTEHNVGLLVETAAAQGATPSLLRIQQSQASVQIRELLAIVSDHSNRASNMRPPAAGGQARVSHGAVQSACNWCRHIRLRDCIHRMRNPCCHRWKTSAGDLGGPVTSTEGAIAARWCSVNTCGELSGSAGK